MKQRFTWYLMVNDGPEVNIGADVEWAEARIDSVAVTVSEDRRDIWKFSLKRREQAGDDAVFPPVVPLAEETARRDALEDLPPGSLQDATSDLLRSSCGDSSADIPNSSSQSTLREDDSRPLSNNGTIRLIRDCASFTLMICSALVDTALSIRIENHDTHETLTAGFEKHDWGFFVGPPV